MFFSGWPPLDLALLRRLNRGLLCRVSRPESTQKPNIAIFQLNSTRLRQKRKHFNNRLHSAAAVFDFSSCFLNASRLSRQIHESKRFFHHIFILCLFLRSVLAQIDSRELPVCRVDLFCCIWACEFTHRHSVHSDDFCFDISSSTHDIKVPRLCLLCVNCYRNECRRSNVCKLNATVGKVAG